MIPRSKLWEQTQLLEVELGKLKARLHWYGANRAELNRKIKAIEEKIAFRMEIFATMKR